MSQHQKVTPESIADANLQILSIPLKRNIRNPLERAVLRSKTEAGNRKALLWIPGRNDSFYHVHLLDRLLASGFDVREKVKILRSQCVWIPPSNQYLQKLNPNIMTNIFIFSLLSLYYICCLHLFFFTF